MNVYSSHFVDTHTYTHTHTHTSHTHHTHTHLSLNSSCGTGVEGSPTAWFTVMVIGFSSLRRRSGIRGPSRDTPTSNPRRNRAVTVALRQQQSELQPPSLFRLYYKIM